MTDTAPTAFDVREADSDNDYFERCRALTHRERYVQLVRSGRIERIDV